MRTPSLQYLYLQKPVTMIVIVCALSVLPWIGIGDFATKGEPREAAVAVSMLETGNWILPTVYADEFAYKPPMAHWLMAAFSLPQGYVSEFSARLPSALAFIVLIGFTLFFFGERIKFQEAFIATLLLLTCLEIHRAGMTTRVDMLLTTFIVLALYALYRWENKLHLKGLPVVIPFLLGCAVLTKGPVGIILPLFIYGVYLLVLNKHSLRIVFKALLYVGVSSLFLPLLWYIAAWKQGGDDFLNVVLAENFGRFFRLATPNINYNLGHENGVWYNFMTLATGFVPWTLFFFFSLFGLKLHWPKKSFKQALTDMWKGVRSLEKMKLFSLVALVCIVFFYSIPSSKRSVYLMPAYPFITVFLAQYAIYLTEYRTKVTRIFAIFMLAVTGFVLTVFSLVMANAIELLPIVNHFTNSSSTLFQVGLIDNALSQFSLINLVVLLFTLSIVIILIYQLLKKINIKILYATIALTFAVNLIIDGVVMRSIRNGTSSKAFAEQITEEYPLARGNTFVTNNLKEYSNLYGLNFYMGNMFHDFEDKKPSEGYFLTTEKNIEKIKNNYADKYSFKVLTTSETVITEVRDKVVLCKFFEIPKK